MIVVLMREDDRVDRATIDAQLSEETSEASRLRPSIDQHTTAAVLDEDRIALSDVEDADRQRRVTRRRSEGRWAGTTRQAFAGCRRPWCRWGGAAGRGGNRAIVGLSGRTEVAASKRSARCHPCRARDVGARSRRIAQRATRAGDG